MSKAADVKNRPGMSSWFISLTALLALQAVALSMLNRRDLRLGCGSILLFIFLIGAARLYRRVSEQEQSEAALREEEDKLRLVLESAAEGIYGIDLNGNFTFCNRTALKLLGYKTMEDLMGRKMHEHIHYMRSDGTPYPASECPIQAVVGNGKAFHTVDEVYWRSDGTSFPVECWAYPQRKGLEMVGAVVSFIDITERRRAEESIRDSTLKFRNMANLAPSMLWTCGTDKLCDYVNQSWLDFTGRPLEEELGTGWTDCVHPEDLERSYKVFTESFDARQSFRMEYRLKRHDDEYRWVLDAGTPRFTESGVFEGYIGSAIDVTEIKLAEKAVATANERLQLALEAGRAGAWDMDVTSGISIQFGNSQVLFGNAGEGGPMQEFWERVHPDDRARLREALESSKLKKTRFREEFRVLCPDGTMGWLVLNGKFLYSESGHPERMLGTTIDITERKQTEEALQTSEQEFSLVFKAARIGWWVWSEETGHVISSEGTKALLGLPSDKEISLQAFLNAAHPDDRDEVYRTWQESLAAGRLYFIEYRVLLTDGTIRWVESRGHTFSRPREGARQLIGVCMDITERKRSEEELRNLGGRLIEAQEQERVRIARELHDDICQRLALLEIELERIKYDPELQCPALRYDMDHLTQFTKEIGSDLQSLSHELHSSKLEILGTAAAMKSFCAEFSRQHNLEVEFTSSNVPFPLSREVSIGLYRVLQEALHNALKHSRMRYFAAQLRGEHGSVELMVRDFGIGFDPGTAARGRGLGLVSMRERINLLNGTLSIESRPMRGTTIRAIVPAGGQRALRCA
ncbi:MAG TPA: PAS domain S-box protein [Candidatus Angelobacter sp.]